MLPKTIQTLLFFSLLLLMSLSSKAQFLDSLLVDGQYDNQPLQDIFEDLDQRYSLQLFIPPSVLPLPNTSATFEQTPLKIVLGQLLQNTDLGFIIYRGYAVVIVPKEVAESTYTAEYYKALEASLNPSNTEVDKTISVGTIQNLSPNGQAVIRGTIKDAATNETIVGASILQTDLLKGTTTNIEGKYNLQLPTGKHSLKVQYVGYDEKELKVQVYGDGKLDIDLDKSSINLDEVVISAEAPDANVNSVQTGVEKLDLITVKQLPTVLGEADIVKVLLLQPGVSTIGEGASGFNVRGGDIDQNLILQDEGILFNSAHALGFYSTFNADLLQNVTLYKGAIPAQFGGRLASVLNVEMRDGNFKEFKIKGGLGPVASRISIEAPIVKDKSSFIAGFRSTYSDWILKKINVPEVKRSSVFFYDANFRYTHRLNPKNTLIFSAYATQDDFEYNNEFGFNYQTLLGQIIYKSIFNGRTYSRLSLSASQFKNEQTDLQGNDASVLQNGINYFKIKEQITHTPSDELKLDAGLSAVLYDLPGQKLIPSGNLTVLKEQQTESEQGVETAAFVNVEWKVSPTLQLLGGIRANWYAYLGEKTVYDYDEGYPYETSNSIGTRTANGIIDSRFNLEPRFSARYKLSPTASLKAGYSRVTQYINQFSNSDTPTPSSHWQLSTAYIPPKQAHSVSIGGFKNFKDNLWETSLDFYGRYLDATYDYKNFAELILNDHIETEIRKGIGRTYGMEFSLNKKRGVFNGSLSYTLSKSELKVDDINRGEWYASNIDKLHDVSLVWNVAFNSKTTLTVNFNYGTGRPTTPPVGNYIGENGLVIPVYTKRNHLRIPDYHRLDLAYTMGMGYNKTKKFKTSWTLSIYNVYGRRNAFSVFYTQEPFELPKANRFSVLGSAFPSISFNFETF